jgi:membrane-associated phospholipid phosphatase
MSANALLALTNFGDLAVLLPITIVVFIWLYYLPARRKAAWWAAAAMLCMAGTALLKILFVMCPPAADLQSPRGHTSLGTLVYGALFMLIAMTNQGRLRYAAIGVGGALVLLIALSRVALHTHTVLETGLGLAIGAGALALFASVFHASPPTQMRLRPLLLSVAVLLVLLHGRQLHAEDLLRAIGGYVKQSSGLSCSWN